VAAASLPGVAAAAPRRADRPNVVVIIVDTLRADHVYGDRDTEGSSSPAAISGYPSITVPAGHVFGLPVGLSFIGRPFDEPTLIKLAFAFEQLTAARIQPRFLAL